MFIILVHFIHSKNICFSNRFSVPTEQIRWTGRHSRTCQIFLSANDLPGILSRTNPGISSQARATHLVSPMALARENELGNGYTESRWKPHRYSSKPPRMLGLTRAQFFDYRRFINLTFVINSFSPFHNEIVDFRFQTNAESQTIFLTLRVVSGPSSHPLNFLSRWETSKTRKWLDRIKRYR